MQLKNTQTTRKELRKMTYNNTQNILTNIQKKTKEKLLNYMIVLQNVLRQYESPLLQELGYMFAENPITDFWFEGVNKHILISDNFETPNFEVMINPNGYISITDDTSTVWYQVTTESPVQLPYVSPVRGFEWNTFDVDSVVNSFASEVDLHSFMELLEGEVSILKQRLWLLKNVTLKLELIEDKKLIQELTSLMEVA